MDIRPHNPFNVLLSSFSSCPLPLSKNAVIGHVLETLEKIIIFQDLKHHLPQSRNGGGTDENFDTSDEESSQKLDADPEQWRTDFRIGSQEESVRKDLSLLHQFASM